MNETSKLAEQNILLSQSHLRHIDELMARANEVHAKQPLANDVQTQLAQFQQKRDRSAQELHQLSQHPGAVDPDAAQRAVGVTGTLQTIGLELEKALTAVFDSPAAGQSQ